jgi:hypothetical protein
MTYLNQCIVALSTVLIEIVKGSWSGHGERPTIILRDTDGRVSLYVSFSTATGTSVDVLINDTVLSCFQTIPRS